MPRPWRGYWQQKAAGKKVRPARLPKLKPEQAKLEIVTLGPRPTRPPPEEETGPLADQTRYEADPKHRIEVPKQISRPHLFVKQTRDYWRHRKRHEYRGIDHLPPPLNIDVSQECQSRALRIMHALLKGLERRGMTMEIRGTGTYRRGLKTLVIVHAEPIEIRLREQLRQVKVEKEAWWGEGTRTATENVPSGRLSLEILEWNAPRKTWTDGKKQRLEDCLNKFVVGLVAAAEAKKEWRKKREEEERRRQEAAKLRRIAERRRQEELRRGERLEAQVASWGKAQQIRHFLATLEEKLEREDGVPNPELRAWLDWAKEYADRIDPLVDSLAGELLLGGRPHAD